jgi:hypothetical protein
MRDSQMIGPVPAHPELRVAEIESAATQFEGSGFDIRFVDDIFQFEEKMLEPNLIGGQRLDAANEIVFITGTGIGGSRIIDQGIEVLGAAIDIGDRDLARVDIEGAGLFDIDIDLAVEGFFEYIVDNKLVAVDTAIPFEIPFIYQRMSLGGLPECEQHQGNLRVHASNGAAGELLKREHG